MKTVHQLRRHTAEILEDGKRIDYAVGRDKVLNMKARHGLLPKPRQLKFDGCEDLPTGMEERI